MNIKCPAGNPVLREEGKAERCEYYRTISLISDGCKILRRIIYGRMEKLVEANLGEDQLGFWRNVGTREVILSLRLILEDMLRKGITTFITFVDLEKAFDNVDCNTLFKILKGAGVKHR